jgi:hypothetical protein
MTAPGTMIERLVYLEELRKRRMNGRGLQTARM